MRPVRYSLSEVATEWPLAADLLIAAVQVCCRTHQRRKCKAPPLFGSEKSDRLAGVFLVRQPTQHAIRHPASQLRNGSSVASTQYYPSPLLLSSVAALAR